MSFSAIYHTILDALFPLNTVEQGLLSLSPEQASQQLPHTTDFSGLAVPLQVQGVHSVFAYKDERVAKLVWNIKYKKSSQAIKIGGFALWQYLKDEVDLAPTKSASSNHILIIPIPITAQRRRERGYNQCELLLDEIERLNISKQKDSDQNERSDQHLIFEKNLLIRTQHVARQTLKGRSDRLDSAKEIFAVNMEVLESLRVEQSKIDSDQGFWNIPVVIIDDVITTGSTMYEAINTLKNAGFRDVRALSLAH